MSSSTLNDEYGHDTYVVSFITLAGSTGHVLYTARVPS